MELQVGFRSQGQDVVGVLHVPARTPAPGIVMCHGFTGNKAESRRIFVLAARELERSGVAVLRFDFRGSGDSAGDFSEMTLASEHEDARAALDFLAARPELDARRLGALGFSMGGAVAACLAGEDPRITALVLWAAVAHPDALRARLMPELGGDDGLDYHGWELGRAFLDELLELDPLAAAAQFRGPALVVQGEGDQSVPPSDARDYGDALAGPTTVRLVPEADHVFARRGWRDQVIAATREFLVGTL